MAKKMTVSGDEGLIAPGETGKIPVLKREDEKLGRTLARLTLDPQIRNANLAMTFGSEMFDDQLRPDLGESSAALGEEVARAMKGDLSLATRLYTSQAISLDALFTELARRSGINMGQYSQAAERYMRLALKAQTACRSTLEALARLHQPREQIVKHVHVNDGGQAVVADHFHNGPGQTASRSESMPGLLAADAQLPTGIESGQSAAEEIVITR